LEEGNLMHYDKNKTKQTEKRCLDALSKYGDFKLSEDEYSPFDLYGYTNNVKTLIEVKERSEMWDRWFIEKQKIDNLRKLKHKTKDPLRIYLLIVVKNDGFLFKVDDIFEMGKIERIRMNKQTSKDFPHSDIKIRKEIINFHHQLNLLKLKLND